jgi:hypothetical protein
MDPRQLQELESEPGSTTPPVTSPAPSAEEGDLSAVSEAMRQLKSLIDEFLDPRRGGTTIASTRTAGALPGTGSAATTGTELAADGVDPVDAGWERAIAVRHRSSSGRGWIEANAAFRRGEHAKAFELFREEAETAAEADDHARACIAYRMASDAAAAMGRRDDSDYDLRRAGKHYLFVAESPTSSLQTMYSSYLAASRCFLAVGNLELTQSCVARAIDLQQAMNEDLHARFNSGPAMEAAEG